MDTGEISRREFLRKTAECAIYGTVGMALSGLWYRSAGASNRPDIVLAKGTPGPATLGAVKALGGIQRFVKPGDRVVIKPNMSFPNPPEWGTTTHPYVVRALSDMCLKAGAVSVLILDNPLRHAELCLERSGLRAVCQGLPQTQTLGVADRRFYEEVEVPEGKELRSTMIMKEVLKADALIAVPVAKSHSATGVSLAMKGMMGLIYDRSSFHLDMDLNRAIVDLCTVLKPQLTVVDATRVLSSGGPGGPGKVIPLETIIASTDMVAADAMAVELGTWYGRKFKASQVKHIRVAHERGLGNMDVAVQSVKEVVA